ncbi:MAG TPA: PIG-L family deacetylase [Thermoanaerobaculia bacterium]|jgi:LmbE family N-acetylglucosaminyl deacetylase|nr:PIG-L family deacetylase [Thermoanaerobaculia bacterium]
MSGPVEPPGTTEKVLAASALIVAPHYDDEVLGCGGLAAQLVASGAAVRVLFLSDGGGGVQAMDGGERDAYRERRREESTRAGEVLGIAGSDHLGLPDGELGERLPEIAAGLSRALLTLRPEILLVPSPLEVSRDHRAAFAAVHRLLSSLRPGPAGETLWADLRVLLYEVNHPAWPDLLVDVTAEEPRLRAAMACYTSQEERHGYLDAALGLRRFRTLTLTAAASLTLAEGYRWLAVADFTTRSLAQLVRHLGGLPEIQEVREGPRISVVVRTRDRPAFLAEALGSLALGSYRNAEVVLVNDGGQPPAVPAGYPLPVVRVDLPESRGRAAAAQAGVEAATGDYVAFLDDDDLAAPEHLATLAGLVGGAGVRVAYTDAAVAVYELDAEGWVCRERRLPYSRDFDPDVLLLDNYIPFNTLLIERRLFAAAGPFDLSLPFFEDWDLLIRLATLAPFHHLARVTCEYRHFRGGGHHIFGERPRERGDFLAVKARVLAKHAALLPPAALARAVDRLRADLIAVQESREAVRRETAEVRREAAELRREIARQGEAFAAERTALGGELSALGWQLHERERDLAILRNAHEELSRERFRFEALYHGVNGDLAALREAHAVLDQEAGRLYGEEEKLRAALAERDLHLGRTYGEIERLNRLVREMESTRAWRAHAWFERRKS